MKEQKDLSQVFLQEFVKQLIINSIKKEIIKPVKEYVLEISQDKQKDIDLSHLREGIERIKSKQAQATQELQVLPIIKSPSQNQTINRLFPPKRNSFQIARNQPNIQNLQPLVNNYPKIQPGIENFSPPKSNQAKAPQAPQQNLIPVMQKLQQILNDPSIQAIECPGPGKQLIITKLGLAQPINLVLSAEEINSLIKDASEKTRIPLVSGFFKAVYNNTILTAIISEFIGTRFIMQKKPRINR